MSVPVSSWLIVLLILLGLPTLVSASHEEILNAYGVQDCEDLLEVGDMVSRLDYVTCRIGETDHELETDETTPPPAPPPSPSEVPPDSAFLETEEESYSCEDGDPEGLESVVGTVVVTATSEYEGEEWSEVVYVEMDECLDEDTRIEYSCASPDASEITATEIPCSSGLVCEEDACRPITECEDTDDGLDIYVRGKTTIRYAYNQSIIDSKIDSCSSKFAVLEYYCPLSNTATSPLSLSMKCPDNYSCQNGVCAFGMPPKGTLTAGLVAAVLTIAGAAGAISAVTGGALSGISAPPEGGSPDLLPGPVLGSPVRAVYRDMENTLEGALPATGSNMLIMGKPRGGSYFIGSTGPWYDTWQALKMASEGKYWAESTIKDIEKNPQPSLYAAHPQDSMAAREARYQSNVTDFILKYADFAYKEYVNYEGIDPQELGIPPPSDTYFQRLIDHVKDRVSKDTLNELQRTLMTIGGTFKGPEYIAPTPPPPTDIPTQVK